MAQHKLVDSAEAFERTVPNRSTGTASAVSGDRLRVLFVVDRVDAPYRYRAMHACMQLRDDGVLANVAYLETATAKAVAGYSVVILFRLPWSPLVESVVSAARETGAVLVFDIDDLIFDPKAIRDLPFWESVAIADRGRYIDLSQRLAKTFEQCDFFIGATERLVIEAAARKKPGAVHPNLAHPRLLSHGAFARPLRRLLLRRPIVSYMSGSATHDMDFQKIASPLSRVLDRVPDARLLVCGFVNLGPLFPDGDPRVIRLPYLDWQILPWVQSLAWLNLAPIAALDHFTNSKSALKFFEAAAVQVPTAASPIHSLRTTIEHGKNGFLCERSSDWEAAIESCLDRSRSLELGARAYQTCLEQHSFRSHRGALAEILGGLVGESWLPRAAKPALVPIAPEQVDPALCGTALQRAKQGINRIRSIIGAVRKFRHPERLATTMYRPAEYRQQRTYLEADAQRIDDALPSLVLEPPLSNPPADGWNVAWQIAKGDTPEMWQSVGEDPVIVSPEISLSSSDAAFLLVSLQCRAPRGSSLAQVYWLSDVTQSYAESSSISFPVIADGKVHSYLVDLRRERSTAAGSASSWSAGEQIHRIRFDPLNCPGEFRCTHFAFYGEELRTIAEQWAAIGMTPPANEFAAFYLYGDGIGRGDARLFPKLPASAEIVTDDGTGEVDFALIASDAATKEALEEELAGVLPRIRRAGALLLIVEGPIASESLALGEELALQEDETQSVNGIVRRVRVWTRAKGYRFAV